MSQGKFIVVDGIEGCGKSTIVDFWKEHLERQGKKIFDFKYFWKKHGRHPEYADIKDADIIFTAEPTYVGIGQVVREELIKNGTDYPVLAIAEGYALDRLILYKKFYIQALQEGKTILTDRSFTTSLAYQAGTDGRLSYETVLSLPGNALALECAPSDLILFTLPPDVAAQRLSQRFHKQDDAIFDKIEFQNKLADVFVSPEYQKIFTSRGAQIHFLSTNDEVGIVQENSLSLLHKILSF